MKKLLITILAALVASGMVFAQSFPDIPSGHWAGDAVEEIADLGIVIGFPDGTFRGNEAFTRYQSALVVSRLLAVIDANMDAELGALRGAMQSMAADMAAQGVRLAAAESAIVAISDTLDVHAGLVGANAAAIAALEAAVAANAGGIAALQGGVAANAAGIAANAAGVAALETGVAANAAGIAANADGVAANAAAIAALQGGVAANAAGIAANADGVAANAAGLAANAAGLAANAARIDALEAALAAMPAGIDEAVMRDLQNQIASVRVAADTAQAQAAAAEARAAGAYDLALQALAGADALAADVAALNQVVQLLAQRVDGLSAPAPVAPAAPAVDLSGIDRNAGDIANIRDFVILLRRDQVALRDRVTALEASGAATAASVSALEARVAALEAKPFLTISGSIALSYQVGRTDGLYDFDVDRVYGLNAKASMGASLFSTGAAELDGDDEKDDGYKTEVGEVAQDRADITQKTGVVVPTITITVSESRSFAGKSSPRGFNDFSAVAVFEAYRTYSGGTGPVAIDFRVKDFKTTFTPIGAAPITFAFGEKVSTAFTPYVFRATDLNGYVATVSSPDFLSFLNPGLTVAYFSDQADGYWRGIRGTMAPSFGDAVTLSGGVSFGQATANAAAKNDDLFNADVTVWGVDGNVGLLGLLTAKFEYASNVDTTDSVLWVTAAASTDLGFLNIKTLGGNYRAIDAGWAGIGTTSSSAPFAVDQVGFGGEIGLGLFNLLDVTAFYDQFGSTANDDVVGFGVKVGAKLFVGFSLSGYFENATVAAAQVGATGANSRAVRAGYTLLDGTYESKFGVELKHDGKADNALISGLNITAGYQAKWVNPTDGYGDTLIYANADYALNVAMVSLTPYVGYRLQSNTANAAAEYSEILAGTGLNVDLGNLPLQPSLMGAVNYRATTYNAANFTASELQWSVGLKLGEFLVPNSSLTAKVGQWVGTNTTQATNTRGAGDDATDISGRRGTDVAGGGAETVFGYEFEWNYYDLRFAYGLYDSSRDWSTAASAQAFSIKYTVSF